MGRYFYEIIGGVLIVLSSLVTELPDSFKRKSWIAFILCAMLYSGVGIYLDGQDRADRNATKQENKGLKTDMGNLLESFSSMVALMVDVRADVVATQTQAAVDKEKHDPKIIANLQARAKAAQELADSISTNILAALVPPMVEEMRDWNGSMKFADNDIDLHYDQMRSQTQNQGDMERLSKEEDQRREESKKEFAAKIPALFTKADSLRRAMLQKIPLQSQTPQDKQEADTFAYLIKNPISVEVSTNFKGEADYLEDLAKRIK